MNPGLDPASSGRAVAAIGKLRRGDAVASAYLLAATILLSNFDVRQALSYTCLGLLIGAISVIVWRHRARAWGVAFVVSIALALLTDFDQLPGIWSDQRITLGTALALLGLLGLTSRRWVFSLALTSFILVAVWIASLTKIEYVGAPLIWHDLLVGIRSWDMFLEFETGKAAAFLVLLLIFPLLWLVEPVADNSTTLRASLLLGLVATAFLYKAEMPDQDALLKMSFNQRLARDSVEPVAVLLGSIVNLGSLRAPPGVETSSVVCCLRANRAAEKLDSIPSQLPHIVVVLLESTFDPATMQVERGELFFPDSYPLQVHTIGGGTWVAEYDLLHGVASPLYGPGYQVINLLGPGEADGRLPIILRSAGYSTTTIYPVAGRFYGASTFHRSLGMEKFLDCQEVPGCMGHVWQDRPDHLFLDKAMDILSHAAAPQFVFLPTIQQHSPHDAMEFGSGKAVPCRFEPIQCGVVREYLRRLDSSLVDYKRFKDQVQTLKRETIVLAFGDHIPADVNRNFGNKHFIAGRKQTFFTVWHSRRGYLTAELVRRVGSPPHLNVAYLDWVLAAAAGLDSEYFRYKEEMIRRCAGEYCAPMPGKAIQ